MEKVSSSSSFILVVGICWCMLVHCSPVHAKVSGQVITICWQNMSLKVKGELVQIVNGTPTLYGLLMTKTYINPRDDEINGAFSIQSLTSERYICMKSTGDVYGLDIHERINRTKETRSSTFTPPRHCLFKATNFTAHRTYRPAKAIFSIVQPSKESGLFFSFSLDGKIEGIRKTLSKVGEGTDESIKTQFVAAKKGLLRRYLNATTFKKNGQVINTRVRRCIARTSPLFQEDKSTKKVKRAVNDKRLKQVIPKCKKKVTRRMMERELRRIANNRNITLVNEIDVDSKVKGSVNKKKVERKRGGKGKLGKQRKKGMRQRQRLPVQRPRQIENSTTVQTTV